MAPRILNEPVRWRFSALSTMGPAHDSERVAELTTGVRITTPRPRWRPLNIQVRRLLETHETTVLFGSRVPYGA